MATPPVDRFNYPKGTHYGRFNCPTCAKPGVIKADTRGRPYFRCPHAAPDLTACSTFVSFGQHAQKRIVAAFEDSQKGQHNDRPARVSEQSQPDTGPGADTGNDRNSGGIFEF